MAQHTRSKKKRSYYSNKTDIYSASYILELEKISMVAITTFKIKKYPLRQQKYNLRHETTSLES